MKAFFEQIKKIMNTYYTDALYTEAEIMKAADHLNEYNAVLLLGKLRDSKTKHLLKQMPPKTVIFKNGLPLRLNKGILLFNGFRYHEGHNAYVINIYGERLCLDKSVVDAGISLDTVEGEINWKTRELGVQPYHFIFPSQIVVPFNLSNIALCQYNKYSYNRPPTA